MVKKIRLPPSAEGGNPMFLDQFSEILLLHKLSKRSYFVIRAGFQSYDRGTGAPPPPRQFRRVGAAIAPISL